MLFIHTCVSIYHILVHKRSSKQFTSCNWRT